MLLARHVLGMAWQLGRAAMLTGRWWIPVLIPLLAVAALVIGTAKVAVPTVVYVFF